MSETNFNLREVAQAAKRASLEVAALDAEARTEALLCIAAAVEAAQADILAANAKDMANAKANGLASAMQDRLRLDEGRVAGMANAVREVAGMRDWIGHIDEQSTRPNGLVVERVRIPLGLVAMIYEARPNVTTDAAALCLRSGNAVLLRGGKEAYETNLAVVAAVKAGLRQSKVPEASVSFVEDLSRETMQEMLKLSDVIDLVIPRGGEGLIRFVTEHSRIPVIQHFKGVCHVYVDHSANLDQAAAIVENAKVQRPGVCNAAETLLVDRKVAEAFLPAMAKRLMSLGVELRGDAVVCDLVPEAVLATEDDWHAEYLDLILAVRVVDGVMGAVAHIQQYGSNHTEAIVAEDPAVRAEFVRRVQSSTVIENASTRFADGGELGLGAEIGISTSKLHAYGPMGAEGLTTRRFVVKGEGQIRS